MCVSVVCSLVHFDCVNDFDYGVVLGILFKPHAAFMKHYLYIPVCVYTHVHA